MKHAAVFLAEGFEEIEAITVIDLLRRAGIETVIVSVANNIEVTGSHKISVKADILLSENNLDELDVLILPGGQPGTKNLESNTQVIQAIKQQVMNGKFVAAICAAPGILSRLGLLNNKRATVYPSNMADFSAKTIERDSKTVVDGCIITSQGVGTAISFALSIIEVLCGGGVSMKIKKDIIYE